MRTNIIKYIIPLAALAWLSAGTALSQERTVIAGLEDHETYGALIEEESRLRLREDSLSGEVELTRSLFRTDPENRQKYSDDILRLEGELFDVRNLLGITAGKINAIEQQYIITNLTSGSDQRRGGPSGQGRRYAETGPVLTANPFFEEHLPPEDHATLQDAQARELRVWQAIGEFRKNYGMMAAIAAELPGAETREVADSLYGKYLTLAALNGKYSAVVDEEFGFVYDTKLYCYNYLLDKLGQRAQLAAFERKIAQTRDAAIAAGEGAQDAEIAAYAHRKALLLDYEKTLAGLAGYELSLDSLGRARSALAEAGFDFPALTVEEKLFLDYADIEFHTPPRYDNRNPVPDVAIHPKGEIYRILLGSFQRVQPVSVLKGAYPVGVLRDGGRFDYYAGGFPTLEEADAAVAALKSKGFRDPRIVRWTDGELRILSPAEADRLLGRSSEGLFRLAIDTGGKALPAVVKEILEDLDIGAEISRSGSLYIIGTFDSREKAAEAMEEILGETDGLDVKIEDVG